MGPAPDTNQNAGPDNPSKGAVMGTINQSCRDVQHTQTDVPPGAPPSGPVLDGSPAPAGAPAAARGEV